MLPNTLSRWLEFFGTKPPHQFSLFANTIFALSGLFNLILFVLTRPHVVLGPASLPPSQVEEYEKKGDVSSVEDMEAGVRRIDSASTSLSTSHSKAAHRMSAGGVVLRKNQLPQRPDAGIEEDDEEETEDSRSSDDMQRVSRKVPSS